MDAVTSTAVFQGFPDTKVYEDLTEMTKHNGMLRKRGERAETRNYAH